MAPIPHKTVRNPRPAQPQTVSTDNVIDDLGRTLTNLQGRQKRLDRNQNDNITVSRQHAQMNESDQQKGKIIFRDVFPERAYKLTLSRTTTITIGYTVDNEFTEVEYERDGREYTFELPDVDAIDTVEVRFDDTSYDVKAYIEDTTTSGGILKTIKEILEKIDEIINGQEDMENEISDIQDSIKDLDERVTALEKEE